MTTKRNYQLSQDFVVELIRCCFNSKKIAEIVIGNLKYEYLVNEAEKKTLQYITSYFQATNKMPTFGLMGQAFQLDLQVLNIIGQLKSIDISHVEETSLLTDLETFIKKAKFVLLYDKMGELYNQGKHNEAIIEGSNRMLEIAEFAIEETYYSQIFKDYENRQQNRQGGGSEASQVLSEKCCFGIHEVDNWTGGGINKGTAGLYMARSGGGKSTALRWAGICNARLGKRVVHFQAEGTQKECEDAYDAAWTSVDLADMEFGVVPHSKQVEIQRVRQAIIGTGGDIFVYAAESFDSMSINDCRTILIDIIHKYGSVDMVIFDYLELFTCKGSYKNDDKGERKRREDVANKMVNIATEFKVAVFTATQSNDINVAQYNDPDFVMTRSQISEFKGAIKPFSYFLTINQTDDEASRSIARIYIDKLRKYKKPGRPAMIYQSLGNSRFYDSARTLEVFYQLNLN